MEKAFLLLEKYGSKDYIGEEVSQKQHAVQTALQAETYCEDNDILIKKDLVLAALLHDIGHLLVFENKNLAKIENFGVKNHELSGSNYLKNLGYSDLVCKLVESHVKTKRYLASTEKDYFNNLSVASKKTFFYQGGYMTLYEIIKFEKDPLFKYYINLREWDDNAKLSNPELLRRIDDLNLIDYYKSLII
jgi:2-amino-1-hydroxyethylphosphonate dioxygenase (glycine-forming)